MGTMAHLRSTEISPKTALFSIGALVLVTAGVLTVIVKTVNRTSTEKPPPLVVDAHDAGKRPRTTPEQSGAPDYHVIMQRDLFRPPNPPAPPPPIAVPALGESHGVVNTVEVPPFAPPKEAPPRPPRPRLSYTGCVEFGGETYALLENLDLDVAQYTRENGVAFGCVLVAIAPRAVTMERDGETFLLKLGEDKPDATPAAEPPPADGPPPAANNGAPPSPPESPQDGQDGQRRGRIINEVTQQNGSAASGDLPTNGRQ